MTTSPEFDPCYLYYGPVVHDGYGCAYNIQRDRVIFAVSAFESNGRTDIEGFAENLSRSMRDMRAMFE